MSRRKSVTNRYLRPIQYMTIKFHRGQAKDDAMSGEIKVQVWFSGTQKSIAARFGPDNYDDAYIKACAGLAEIMEYPRVPKHWMREKPSLDEVLRHCKIDIEDGKFVREPEAVES